MKLIEQLPSIEVKSRTGNIRKRKQGRFFCPVCKEQVIKELTNGLKSVSCGKKKCTPSRSFRHGFTGTPLYICWANMKSRCDDPNQKAYKYYGAKGISYPDKWKTFKGFLEDMGETYKSGMTIDRLDNTKSYSKENCQWLSKPENVNKDKKKGIIQFDKEERRIVEFFSVKDAALLLNLHPAGIARAARDERKQYKGFIWKYVI